VRTLARGGRRQGQAGKSYGNRTDLNVDRAPQPGSSAPGAPTTPDPVLEQAAQHVAPDSFPNLTDPTNYPDVPATNRLPGGPGADFDPLTVAQNWNPLLADALAAFPGDPDLLRIARFIQQKV